MSKIVPCLWFDGQAEEAAKFYAALIPDSRIDKVMRAPSDNPSTPEGAVLTVDFTLAGQQFIGLNGGPQFPFTEAVSFTINCEDQAEVDRYWNAPHRRRRRAEPVRLAEGQVRPLLADRARATHPSSSAVPTAPPPAAPCRRC